MWEFKRRLLTLVIVLAAVVPALAVGATSTDGASRARWIGVLAAGGADQCVRWSDDLVATAGGDHRCDAVLSGITGDNGGEYPDPARRRQCTDCDKQLHLPGAGRVLHRHGLSSHFRRHPHPGGDPSGTGLGTPGYTIPSDPTLGPYPIGAVAMANALPNQNGSQFFIAAADLTASIPANYPVFGQVIGGIEVVQAISQGAVQAQTDGEQSKPVEPTTVLSVAVQNATAGSTAAGPVVAAPTQTPVVAAQPTQPATAPTQTPAVATQPTATTTAGAAQGRPGGSTASANPTGVAGAAETGCAGFEEYQAAFEEAYTTAAIANPEALAFLLEAQNNPETQNIFEEITPEEATALSGFYLSLSDGIALITPPAFAAEWHAAQIEIFRALGEFTANIASQGLTIASMQASAVMSDLSSRADAGVVAAEAACAGFAVWATGEEPE